MGNSIVSRSVASGRIAGDPALRRVVWSPNDPEFKAEYARRLEVGEDVCVMEGAMRRGGLCTLDL